MSPPPLSAASSTCLLVFLSYTMIADVLVFFGVFVCVCVYTYSHFVGAFRFVLESQRKYCINFRNIYLHRHRVLLA